MAEIPAWELEVSLGVIVSQSQHFFVLTELIQYNLFQAHLSWLIGFFTSCLLVHLFSVQGLPDVLDLNSISPFCGKAQLGEGWVSHSPLLRRDIACLFIFYLYNFTAAPLIQVTQLKANPSSIQTSPVLAKVISTVVKCSFLVAPISWRPA